VTEVSGQLPHDDRVRLVGLWDLDLDAPEVHRVLADRRAGGLAVFVGAVRDHDAGSRVVSLTYSAHPTAAAKLLSVVEGVAARCDVIGLAAIHRIGELRVGDLAVVVGACAVHRDEAFTACRALIDELKATVPIWKQQVFADGSQQWVGTP